MQEKELIINKPSDLLNVFKRKEYTKLTLNCEVNPKLLYGFDNVKELTISSKLLVDKHINEQNINSYSFTKSIEKLNFINIKRFGRKEIYSRKKRWTDTQNFSLNCPNLKSINFNFTTGYFYTLEICNGYIVNSNNLEELLFDVRKEFGISGTIYCPRSLKNINVLFKKKKYNLNLLYNPYHISDLYVAEKSKIVKVKYYGNELGSGSEVGTSLTIDIIANKKEEKTCLEDITDNIIKNNSLYIPDYVTDINIRNKNYYETIEDISFNINLLNNIISKTYIADSEYLYLLKTITIRNNSNMALFPKKVINVRENETVKDLYIENNKLYIVYEKEMLVVNNEGVIEKEIIIKEEPNEIKEEKVQQEINLDIYSISDLEEYLQYRKLLEKYKDSKDEELVKAVNVIGKRLVKELNKGDNNE